MSAIKPQMRGFLVSRFKRNMIITAIACTTVGSLYRVFVCNARKQRYADFYKNYDAEAEFEAMRALGVFQSARPD